ncbi:hypothetical protein RHGRI_029522 [Rhododendron griersonianum]|uniref:Uncharacterized protein n=1 Tax=Rhododendron griersonianum TaxID=479676 RepID=A0AAV6IKA8_9ERIC|nr:hypothetical protein RHGRI_029522 [Rhododendron griersonianum]
MSEEDHTVYGKEDLNEDDDDTYMPEDFRSAVEDLHVVNRIHKMHDFGLIQFLQIAFRWCKIETMARSVVCVIVDEALGTAEMVAILVLGNSQKIDHAPFAWKIDVAYWDNSTKGWKIQ